MMTYGYPIQDHNDPFIDIVDKATEQFAVASMPGAFLVDTFPWRKYTIHSLSLCYLLNFKTLVSYIPDWLPGTQWKKTAAAWRKTLFDMANLPYNYSRQTLVCSL